VSAGNAKLFGRLGGRQGTLTEGSQHMPDERGRVAIG
jgi:hypothetical protein